MGEANPTERVGKTLLILPAAAMGWMSEAKSIPERMVFPNFSLSSQKELKYGEKTIVKNEKNELPFIGNDKTPQSIEVTNSGYMFEEDVLSAGYHLQCRLIYTDNI